MKSFIITALLLFLGTVLLSAQGSNSEVKKIKLAIENLNFSQDNSSIIDYMQITSSDLAKEMLKDVIVEVKSGELHLTYLLQVKNDTRLFDFTVEKIETSDKKEIPYLQDRLYGDIGIIQDNMENKKTFIIANDAKNSNPFLLSGTISIYLKIERYKFETKRDTYLGFLPINFSCNESVDKLNLIHLNPKKGYGLVGLGALASVGSFGASWAKQRKFENSYASYRNHSTKQAAQDDYLAANSTQIENSNWRKTSLILGGVSLAGFIIQKAWHNKRKQLCKQCNGRDNCSIEFINEMSPNLNVFSNGIAGIGIQYNF